MLWAVALALQQLSAASILHLSRPCLQGERPLNVHPSPSTRAKRSMEQIAAQLEQLNDRARERAVSLAEAVRSAEGGEAGAIEQLQHQQDDQLEVRRFTAPVCGAGLNLHNGATSRKFSQKGQMTVRIVQLCALPSPLSLCSAARREVLGHHDRLVHTGGTRLQGCHSTWKHAG